MTFVHKQTEVGSKQFPYFFNTNSLMDRHYHTFSFVSLKMHQTKAQLLLNKLRSFSDIKGYHRNTIAS